MTVKKPKENTFFYILIIIIIVVEACAIYFLEHGIENNTNAIIGIFLYTLVAFLFLQILKRGRLGIANSLWQSGAVVMISFISVVIIKEKMDIYEWIGLLLSVLSILLIAFSPSEDNIKKTF